jgi:prevent-host-death family protein
MILLMATFRISESEAARNFASLMARVRAGAEVVIESDSRPVAVLHSPIPVSRTLEEAIALLPENSSIVMGEDFARDVEDGIAFHREPLNPPSWK